MEIKAKPSYSGTYNELVIKDNNTKMESGLLDGNESRALALSLIDAAADLIKTSHPDHYDRLVDIFNELS